MPITVDPITGMPLMAEPKTYTYFGAIESITPTTRTFTRMNQDTGEEEMFDLRGVEVVLDPVDPEAPFKPTQFFVRPQYMTPNTTWGRFWLSLKDAIRQFQEKYRDELPNHPLMKKDPDFVTSADVIGLYIKVVNSQTIRGRSKRYYWDVEEVYPDREACLAANKAFWDARRGGGETQEETSQAPAQKELPEQFKGLFKGWWNEVGGDPAKFWEKVQAGGFDKEPFNLTQAEAIQLVVS